MQGGDLSNEVAPRVLLVFEGLIAYPPEGREAVSADVARRLRRWKTVVKRWHLDETMVKQMWDLAWRRGIKFDVVTFLYEEAFAVALWYLLDDLGMPMSRVLWFQDAQALARSLVYMPDVQAVYTADNALVFGGLGRQVRDRARDLL